MARREDAIIGQSARECEHAIRADGGSGTLAEPAPGECPVCQF